MCISEKREQQISDLLVFNQKLLKTQELIYSEAVKLDAILKSRVENIDDELDEYELDYQLTCFLKENDPREKDYEDGFIIVREILKQISYNKDLYDSRWNKIYHLVISYARDLPYNIPYSWLFSIIYDQMFMDWDEISRIGRIWSDIVVLYKFSDSKYEKNSKDLITIGDENKTTTRQSHKDALIAINKRLVDLQGEIVKKATEIDEMLIARVDDKNDPLEDYEINLHMAFKLKEDDLEYKDGYIFDSITEYIKSISRNEEDHLSFLTDTTTNYSDSPHIYSIPDIHQCWLFHMLHDYTRLGWQNMFRIGKIEYGFRVFYQYCEEIDKELL